MMLEAVWFRNGKEIFKVAPVMVIVCDDDMKSIDDIEIENGYEWFSCKDADDFVIRISKGE